MMPDIGKKLVDFRNYLLYKWYALWAAVRSKPIATNHDASFVVSIASYPKRDHFLPAVFEALNRQTVKPSKWILVLSEEEYPQGLSMHLKRLQSLGVEILWVKDNPYAVKKLLPVLQRYPDLAVVTLDDDILYHPSLLRGLIEQVDKRPGTILGYVGKVMVRRGKDIQMYYREPYPADLSTPPEQVYLIGWGGIYYPPGSLDRKVMDMNAVHRIVPGRGSDIWFWAATHAQGTPQICLGVPESHRLGIPIPQSKVSSPKDQPGAKEMGKRFQMAIDYFGLRNKLFQLLPSKDEKSEYKR